jgi:hypothetical protein|tara:strand:+ start:3763 stop:5334 length:1572 start_codon:yes stop_codon:yes gene_type:complete
MNKNLKYFIVISLIIISFISCNVLDEDPFTNPSTENFYKNQSDAQAALTSVYARLKSGNGYYKQQFLSTLHASSDQGLSSYLFKEFKIGIVISSNQSINSLWKEIYLGIRDANNVIAKVPDINMDKDLKNRFIGEAKFLRALNYFNLVRCFGEVPLRTEPLKAGDDQGLAVSSIVKIYDVIINDLNFAATHCWKRNESRGNYTNNLGRATSTSAHALLAKVYARIASSKRTASEGNLGNKLYLEFPESYINYYQYAKKESDLAIMGQGFKLSGNLEEWGTIFEPNNGNNSEMIFDIQGSSLTGQGTAVSNLFSPRNAGLSGSGFGGANKLKGKFINDRINKSDNRFQKSIISQYETSTRIFDVNPGFTGYIPTIKETGKKAGTLWQIWTGKYIDKEATTEYTSRQNWHIIRLADVYLIRAEANAEINSDPSAANIDINLLRKRVGMSDINYSSLTMSSFRKELLKERAVELYMEGHRFFDLTRFGVYDEYCRSIYGNIEGARQPEDYLWPIPLIEVSTNNKIN